MNAASADPADQSISRFLAQDKTQHAYRAVRRLEAGNGAQNGWLEATTEYGRATGFHYQVTAEGGSGYVRSKVLRALLDAERDEIEHGDADRASLAPANYTFRPNGVDADGLVTVQVSPRRKDGTLVSGTMFLQRGTGALVRLEGRLAKSPSFWVKTVDIVRLYEPITGAIVPVLLESRAQLRGFGRATLRMSYRYVEIDGRPVVPSRLASSAHP